jgi:hyperosmotically inducible periplasmic protein
MILHSYKTILASALIVTGLSLGSVAVSADKGSQEIIDVRQETQISTTYALSRYLRADNLDVSVHNGKATIKGTVAEDVNKDLAEQIALGVNGIKQVDNQVIVKADHTPVNTNPGERSYGEVIDDASITAVVKSKLLWSKHADGLATNVSTKAGRVTLEGTADNESAKTFAGLQAKHTDGVVAVDNQLKINEKSKSGAVDSAKKSVKGVGDDASDTWITTKVKSTFIYSSNVDSDDISVSTKDGVVSLSGKVGSGAERQLAIELAQNIRGVKSVQSKDLAI